MRQLNPHRPRGWRILHQVVPQRTGRKRCHRHPRPAQASARRVRRSAGQARPPGAGAAPRLPLLWFRPMPDPTGPARMASIQLPSRIGKSKRDREHRSCPAHRAWVRRHRCCVPGCANLPIECAHVRRGTDGGQSLKPSDRWTVSLCREHHAEQHQIGERAFETRYGVDLRALAEQFAGASPHRERLRNLSQPSADRWRNDVESGAVCRISEGPDNWMPPPRCGSAKYLVDERLDILKAYRRLLELSSESELQSQRCWSPVAANAFKAASLVQRSLASALYKKAIKE